MCWRRGCPLCCDCCPIHPPPSGDGSEGGMCAGRFPASDLLDCCMMSLTCREWARSLERDDLQTPGLVCTPRVGNFTCSLPPCPAPANQNIQKNSGRGEFLLLGCMQSFRSWELGLNFCCWGWPQTPRFPFPELSQEGEQGELRCRRGGGQGQGQGSCPAPVPFCHTVVLRSTQQRHSSLTVPPSAPCSGFPSGPAGEGAGG